MKNRTRTPLLRRLRAGQLVHAVAIGAAALALAQVGAAPAQAASYPRIGGEGSSWAGGAWADWLANAATQGVTVDYTPNGSSVGRDDFASQTNATFADSEIPFTGAASDPQDQRSPGFRYGMLPVVAGGTAFMYNLPIGGTRYTKLNLSMADIAGIFSGQITQWNDPLLAADNPGVSLPDHVISVVVRSDGSGATAQFKLWMLRQFPAQYRFLASHTGGSPTAASSYFPIGTLKNFISANGSNGVTTYTTNTDYTIDYDEYAFAQAAGFPVAQVKNAAGYYTTPTADAVAVALTHAVINTNKADPDYLAQDLSNVYTYKDPRSYPMSMYSYEIVPNQTTAVTTTAKGATLGWLSTNAVCEWQREMGSLGYSPLPMNLVLASLDQLKAIPGIDSTTLATIAATENGVLSGGKNPCNNPTFQPGDDPSHNLLVDKAPFPAGCNAACAAPWKLAGTGVANSGPKYNVAPAKGSNAPAGTDVTTSGKGGKGTKQTCDADTGVCTDATTASSANLKAVPTVITETTGWAGPQTLGVLCALLALLLLLAPPIVNRVLARGRRMKGGGA